MKPTLYLIRHGDTDLNDPKDEKFRAWTDVPLNRLGVEDAETAAVHLRLHTIDRPVYRVVASDLQRTVMTGHIVKDELQVEMRLERGLRPWNLGETFTGKSVKEHAAELNKYQDNPTRKIPGGESYQEFYDRYSETLKRLLAWTEKHPDKPLVAVTHSRNLLALPTIVANRPVGDVPVKGGPAPAEIVRLCKEGDSWKVEKVK